MTDYRKKKKKMIGHRKWRKTEGKRSTTEMQRERISLAELFKVRIPRSNLACIKASQVIFLHGEEYQSRKGLILGNEGKRMVRVLDLQDGSLDHRRHLDQTRILQSPEKNLGQNVEECQK